MNSPDVQRYPEALKCEVAEMQTKDILYPSASAARIPFYLCYQPEDLFTISGDATRPLCPVAVPYPPVARPDVPWQEKSRRLARLSPPLANKRRNPETTSSQRRVVASTGAANQSAERAARSSSVSLAWRPTRPKIPRALGSVFFIGSALHRRRLVTGFHGSRPSQPRVT